MLTFKVSLSIILGAVSTMQTAFDFLIELAFVPDKNLSQSQNHSLKMD